MNTSPPSCALLRVFLRQLIVEQQESVGGKIKEELELSVHVSSGCLSKLLRLHHGRLVVSERSKNVKIIGD
jgi:hypothetical protein